MKFFITELERKNKHTTCCFEFQRGSYCGKHWREDSICLHADIFDEFYLYEFFSNVVLKFAYYGSTEVSKKEWEALQILSHQYGGVIEEIISELTPWAEECFKTEKVFTICGI